MCEMTPTQFVKEFERLSNIAPRMDAYFCEYAKQRMSKMMPVIQDLINFIEQNSKFKCFYLNKYEFIDNGNQDKPFFNKRKLEERVNEICSGNEKVIDEDEKHILETLYKYFTNRHEDKSTQAATFNLIDCNLLIVFDLNTISGYEPVIFHELCHCLQNVYNSEIIERGIAFDQILEDTRSDKRVKKTEKERFLNTYVRETQANLFGYMVMLLYGLNNKNFDELKNSVIFQSGHSHTCEYGYCEYPLLLEEVKNMQNNPQQYQRFFVNKFIPSENTTVLYPKNPLQMESNIRFLDYKKLYDYTRKRVLNKSKKIIAKALSLDKRIGDELEDSRLKILKDLSYHLDFFIRNMKFYINSKELLLDVCEYELETVKTNLSQKLSERVDVAFNTLVDNLKKDGVEIC